MKTDSFKNNMSLLNALNESEALTEKINKDNIEINDKIRKALRSKGEARKLEPELAKHGIEIDYSQPQGTTMKGSNGKRLSDDKHNIYGPSEPGFNRTHEKADRRYRNYSKDYKNKAEEYRLKLKQLKALDRDDIIRRWPDKSTEEAMKAYQEELERTEKWAKDYENSAKEYADDDLRKLKNAKAARRNGHKNDPRSGYNSGISKDDAEYKDWRHEELKNPATADKVDYLTYLTKKQNGFRKGGDSYWSGSEYDPADDMNKKIKDYKELKGEENRAEDHLRFKRDYYGVKSDDELNADAEKMRAEVEAKIKAAQEQNEKNKKDTASAEAGVQAAKKNIQDYMKKVREERANKTKAESEETKVDNKINESEEENIEFKVGDTVKVPYKYGVYTPGEFTDAPIIDIEDGRYITVEVPSKQVVHIDQLRKWNKGIDECDKSLTEHIENINDNPTYQKIVNFIDNIIYSEEDEDRKQICTQLKKDMNIFGNLEESEKLTEEYSDKLGGDPNDFVKDVEVIKQALEAINTSAFGSHLAQQMIEDWIDTCNYQIEKGKRLASGDEFYTESEKINEVFEDGNAIFELKFDCSNEDTYGTGIELSGNIAETLKGIAGKIESSGDTEGPIMDINGNKVGSYGLGYKGVISTVEEN